MKFVCIYSIVYFLFLKYSFVRAKVSFVSDYNAYPNDNIDDTQNIQVAINAAIDYGLNSVVTFGYGIYNLSDVINISNATNLTVIGQGIDQTWLIGNGSISIFSAIYCNGLKLTAFSIDFDPLPFTGGYVVQVNDSYMDVQVQEPHRADVDRHVRAIFRFDPKHMRPAFGPDIYDIYQTLPVNATTKLVSSNILRIPLAAPTNLLVGNSIVARYLSNKQTIIAQDINDLAIQSVNIYSSWSLGVLTIRIRRFNIIDFHVRPGKSRWLSTNADGLHLSDTREYLSLIDSECQMTGDDSLNLHAPYFNVSLVINSTALIIGSAINPDLLNVGVGTHLEFSSKIQQQQYIIHAIGEVVSSIKIAFNESLFLFTHPINASVGDWVCISDAPIVTIRNFTATNTRGRGILAEARNIDVRRSIFNRTSSPAILFQPSLHWYEGPTARNVTLTENLYINCNEGIGQYKGIITIFPMPLQITPVINNIRIESSTFIFGNYSQGLLESNNANDVYINDNYLATNNSTPLVSICNSRNITANNNTVVDGGFKIEQYYVFDSRYPCKANLSSLIDLPPSAFNSSFLPPVNNKR